MSGPYKRIATGAGATGRVLVYLLMVIASQTSAADDGPTWTVGVQYGGDTLEDLGEDIYLASLYVRRQMASPDWLVRWTPPGTRLHIDATASHLEVADDDAAQLAVGPVLVWHASEGPWRLAGGIQPTLISDHEVGERDLGGALQFSSHLGAGVALGERIVVELQWRHISNAHLYDANDGIDVQLVNLGWRF